MTNVIERVRSLKITGFRGFVGDTCQAIDTDADIVLLVGANGHGKSSLLEALLLVLTRAILPNRAPRSLFSRVPRDHGESTEVDTYRIEAKWIETDTRGRSEPSARAEVSRAVYCNLDNPDQIHSDPPELPNAATATHSTADPALRARLTAFFQDDVNSLFDDLTHGRTLLDIMYPKPVLTAALGKALAEAADRCRREADAALPAEDEGRRDQDQHRFDEWVEHLRAVLEAARPLHTAWPTLPTGSSAYEWRNAIRALYDADGRLFDGGANLPREVVTWIVNRYPDWVEAAEARARASLSGEGMSQLLRERTNVEAELRSLLGDHPTTVDDAAVFAGSADEHTSLPSLLEVLRSLHQHQTIWIADARRRLATFRDLAQELEAIDAAKLAAQTRALARWQEQRRQVRDRRDLLQHNLAELDDRLRRATPDTDLSRALRAAEPRLATLAQSEPWRKVHAWLLWDEDHERREQRKAHLRSRANELEALAERVAAPTSEVGPTLDALGEALNQVASRFKLGPGALPIRVAAIDVEDGREARLTFADGRDLGHFSSGQRSQVAVAFMVAQNQLVRSSETEIASALPHRILILDDVATTYDLSNLAAETLLWRQLAYTADPALKRQIFISSHHEDLTNQLIDLLAPPGSHDSARSYSMRILRFTDWAPKNGPIIKQQRVKPTAATPRTKTEAESLRAELEAILYEGSP